MYLSAGALDGLVGLAGELDHAALGAPANGARHVQRRRRGRAARQHEGAQRLELGVHRVDLVLEPLDLCIAHAQRRSRALLDVAALRHGEVGAEIEQVVLDARQHGVERRDALAR